MAWRTVPRARGSGLGASRIEQLHLDRLEMREERSEAELALGRHIQITGELGSFVNEQPRRERAVRQYTTRCSTLYPPDAPDAATACSKRSAPERSPSCGARPEFIRHFEAEARMVARVEDPHIVPLIDFWRDPDSAYLVMRWMSGGTLERRLDDGPLTTDETLVLAETIGSALSTAHRHGVVHRDLKPSNLLNAAAQSSGTAMWNSGSLGVVSLLIRSCPHRDDFALPK